MKAATTLMRRDDTTTAAHTSSFRPYSTQTRAPGQIHQAKAQGSAEENESRTFFSGQAQQERPANLQPSPRSNRYRRFRGCPRRGWSLPTGGWLSPVAACMSKSPTGCPSHIARVVPTATINRWPRRERMAETPLAPILPATCTGFADMLQLASSDTAATLPSAIYAAAGSPADAARIDGPGRRLGLPAGGDRERGRRRLFLLARTQCQGAGHEFSRPNEL